ncbi:hypothetical protein [Streptomyces sp. DZ1-3]
MPRRNSNVKGDPRPNLRGELSVQVVRRINRKARRTGWAVWPR